MITFLKTWHLDIYKHEKWLFFHRAFFYVSASKLKNNWKIFICFVVATYFLKKKKIQILGVFNEMRNNHLIDLRWPNEYDRNMTTTNINNWLWPKPWQRQTLFIEYDRNWNWQTFWNWQTLTLRPGSS